jgi:hypothetical protein
MRGSRSGVASRRDEACRLAREQIEQKKSFTWWNEQRKKKFSDLVVN